MQKIASNFRDYSGQNSPSFKANIYLVSKKAFQNTLEQLPDAFQVGDSKNLDWVISEAAVNKVCAYTKDVYNCVLGSIFNPETKRVNLFHLSPYEKTMPNVQKVMVQVIEQAKQLKGNSKGKLQGLLMGGNPPKKEGMIASIRQEIQKSLGTSVYEGSERQTYWDVQLVKAAKEAFAEIAARFGMDYTVITGRKSPCFLNIISDASKNTHYVNVGNAFLPVRSESDLASFYKTRIISPKDNIGIL